MIQSTYRFSLDIHEDHSNVCLNVKRGDTNSRKLHITLTEDGFPYEISDECYAVFTATKPDGKIVYNDCDIDDDTIIYELTPQTTAASGVMDCEIQLYGADDALLTSSRFLIVVDDTVYDTETEIESTDEYNALVELISKTIGLQNALPAPPSAEVGQLIAVSAVDRNGVVTKTIAVDPPKAATGNASAMVSGVMLSPGYVIEDKAYLSAHIEETEG